MVDKNVHDELIKTLDQMPLSLQKRVLEFAFSLQGNKLPRGTPGQELLKFAGTISKEDGEEMLKAIEEGCEKVDPDGW